MEGHNCIKEDTLKDIEIKSAVTVERVERSETDIVEIKKKMDKTFWAVLVALAGIVVEIGLTLGK